MTTALATVGEMQVMAKSVVDSKMFPQIKNEAQAMTLMLLCVADGLHPMQAVRRYHILGQGQLSMRADTMLAEFQSHGGRVAWLENSETACEGEFSAPGLSAPAKVKWTMDDAKRAGLLGNQTWQKYPRAMLRSRCISEGIRLAMPGVVAAIYETEEVESFSPPARDPVASFERNREVVSQRLAAVPEPDFHDAVADDGDDAEITDPVPCYDAKTGEEIGTRDGCTNRQKSKAHVLKAELGITDDQWRDRMQTLFGKDSMTELSREEADSLITKLESRKRTYGTAADKQARQARRMDSAVTEIAGALANLETREPGAEG